MKYNVIIYFGLIFTASQFQIEAQILGLTDEISQHGITWRFDAEYEHGRYVNGDYWIIDPGEGVNIIEIIPGHRIEGERHMNGSMINPSTSIQGFDSYHHYNADMNAGIGLSESSPLILRGDNSLVSTISNLEPGGTEHVSYVKTVAVLTCHNFPPPEGSFRPGISSANKTVHSINSLNRHLLLNLEYHLPYPDISAYQNYLQMVWLSTNLNWDGRFMRPSDGVPSNYYFPLYFSESALMLHLDYPEDEKEGLLINFIQLGIDIFSLIEAGVDGLPPGGGYVSGRKWPVLFAGLMLDYDPMKSIGDVSGSYIYADGHGPGNPPPGYIHFAEDGQTFYVSQEDVDITNGPAWNPDGRSGTPYPYTEDMIGMPEWGIRYSTHRNQSDAAWYAIYRTIGSGPPAWAGTILAVNFMEAKAIWNHPPFFDYMERYMVITNGEPDPFGYTVPGERAGGRPWGFIGEMWERYYEIYNSPVTANKEVNIPVKFTLEQNYPNPFNPSTSIGYTLSASGYVSLIVYDILGREVITLVNENKPAGKHTIEWKGVGSAGYPSASGIYFYKLRAGDDIVGMRKMVLQK